MIPILKRIGQAISRPYVKKRIDAEVALFANGDAPKPLATLTLKSNRAYKLWCLVALGAVSVLAIGIVSSMEKLLKKLF